MTAQIFHKNCVKIFILKHILLKNLSFKILVLKTFSVKYTTNLVLSMQHICV